MILRFPSWLRRPASAGPASPPPEAAEFIDVLPVRVPADHLTRARRHAFAAIGHTLGAVRDTDRWHDATTAEEVRVRHIAALHQLDAAQAEIATARAILAEIARLPEGAGR